MPKSNKSKKQKNLLGRISTGKNTLLILAIFLIPFAVLAVTSIDKPLFGSAETIYDGSLIAMTSQRDGNQEIYTFPSNNGSAVKRLTNHAAIDDQATWEPGQQRLAFASERTNGRNIWVMNADGSNQRMLTTTGSTKRPVWSPDGSVIGFIGKGGIHTIKPDGSDLKLIIPDSVFGEGPGHLAWSPDMQWFAVTLASRSASQDIYKVRVDGTELTQLTTDTGIDRHAAWSPDGTSIAWDSKPAGSKKFGIYTMNVDGTNKKAVVPPGKNPAEQPTWSLDSQSIAYASSGRIYKVDRNGGAVIKLTLGPKDESPEWKD